MDPVDSTIDNTTGVVVEGEEEKSSAGFNPMQVCLEIIFDGLSPAKQSKQKLTKQKAVIPAVSVLESLSFVKQVLLGYLETCHLSNYNFVTDFEGNPLNEFTEISSLLQASEDSETQLPTTAEGLTIIQLIVVPELYDLKRIKQHIVRVSDAISNPPMATVVTDPADLDDALKIRASAKVPANATKAPTGPHTLPTAENVFSGSGLGALYTETLFRFAKASSVDVEAFVAVHSKPGKCITSVAASNWNPVPSHRRMHGDLMYIELISSQEGVFHITATCHGFYVNKSNRHHFDPTPAVAAHPNHDLFLLIHSICPSLRAAWSELAGYVAERLVAATNRVGASSATEPEVDDQPLVEAATTSETVYSGLGEVFSSRTDDFDFGSVVPEWIVYQPGQAGPDAVGKTINSCNTLRTHAFLTDSFGVDQSIPLREWNEEMQSVRAIQPATSYEAVAKARYQQRANVDFYEACKAGAVAVVDGNIPALNPMDPPTSQVYVYNNIFFSRALDSKETFKICRGDAAARKAAGHDVKCQQMLSGLDVPNLSTVMTCVVDYKGDRIIAQTIIPGVLMSGVGAARLMYGAIEFGKRLSVKEEALTIMKSIGEKFYLPTRNISAMPIPASSEAGDVAAVAVSGEDGAADPAAAVQTSIRTDTDDECVALDSPTVPHVGPVEAKLLKGGDGRIYALEFTRLTPLDANYVPTALGGTGAYDEEILAKGDDTLRAVYVLRPELIRRFLESKLESQQRTIVREIAEKQKEFEDPAAAEGRTEEEQRKKSEELAAEISSRLSGLSLSSVSTGFEISANSFVNVAVGEADACTTVRSDVDDSIAAKDDQQARELALYLFNESIPAFVNEIRTGESIAMDGASLTEAMHSRGINMRYLGRLAQLAQAQELDDTNMAAENKQRVHMMPTYFQDLVVAEMVARAVKHVANGLLSSDSTVKNAPAATLTSLLNCVLGTTSSATSNGADVAVSVAPRVEVPVIQSKKQKKKKSSATQAIAAEEAAIAGGATAFPVPNAASDRVTTLTAVENTLLTRFLVIPLLINRAEGSLTDASTFLHPRVSRPMIMRRICQLLGLRVACRNYNFATEAPVSSDDILNIVPVGLSSSGVGSISCSREDFLAPVVRSLVNTSQRLTSEGLFTDAFEVVRQAHGLAMDISGAVSREAIFAMDQTVSVLINVGDLDQALHSACQMLSTTAQFTGLDSADTLQQHVRIASIVLGMRKLYTALPNGTADAESTESLPQKKVVTAHLAAAAVSHLMAAKYITELIGGPRHVNLVDIFRKLGMVYFETGDLSLALTCLIEAKTRVYDLTVQAIITQSLAEVLAAMGHLGHAVDTQRQAHKLLLDIYGESDEKVAEAKKLVEKYFRASTEQNVKFYRQLQAEQEQALAAAAQHAREKQITGAAGTPTQSVASQEAAAGKKGKAKKVVGLTEAEIEADAIMNAKKKLAKKKGGKK